MSKQEVIENITIELPKISYHYLQEIQEMIQKYKVEQEHKQQNAQKIMAFAGCWSDMKEDVDDFIEIV